MRPILSAKGTYNYELAKWLDSLLKPLAVNEYMIQDTFRFAKELASLTLKDDNIIVSFDVVSLFTNVPVDETIEFLLDRAFEDNGFKLTYP